MTNPPSPHYQRSPIFTAKKHYGQNFLIDDEMKARIINACSLNHNENVLEIGPGQGVLTECIAPAVKTLYAVEKDPWLYHELQKKAEQSNVHIIKDDILRYDFSSLPAPIKVIGNLPYNISTPIIQKLISCQRHLSEIFLTLQLEFAERLSAQVNQESYGSFSCFVQYYADIKILFKMPAWCFRPIPKVTSCFVHLHPRPPQNPCLKEDLLFQIIQKAFLDRRKKVGNALAGMLGKETTNDLLETLKLSNSLRAENLSLKNYVDLTNLCFKNRGR